MESSHVGGHRAARRLTALAAALCAIPVIAAADSSLLLGGTERWASMAQLEGVSRAAGRWGELDLVLADAAHEPTQDTDLLLHFDTSPPSDAAGRYDVQGAAPELSTRERIFGLAAAAFVTPRNALRLYPRAGSLFAPGTMWQDFSVEFWLYPASLGDGETVLAWSGKHLRDAELVEQGLSCTVRNRRLVFRFDNLFQGGMARSVELRGITALLPRQWHHHLIRFDSRSGLLEYLLDGIPEAVTYATDTRRDRGSIALPIVGSESVDPLVIGGGVQACLDELRVSRRFVEEPVLRRLPSRTGTAVSRVFDLTQTGTRVSAIDAVYDRPAETEVYFFYRMADRLKSRGELETEWVQFVPGSTSFPSRGRYLQLMVELFPDGKLQRSPSVSGLTVRYVPDLAPASPAKLVATTLDGGVRLAWSAVNESDLAGYRVYVGLRPGVYDTVIDVGKVTTHEITGLGNGTLYFFTVASYDAADPTRRSAFAPEVGARPSKLAQGRA